MTTLREFAMDDLLKFNNINLDVLTETYNMPFVSRTLLRYFGSLQCSQQQIPISNIFSPFSSLAVHELYAAMARVVSRRRGTQWRTHGICLG